VEMRISLDSVAQKLYAFIIGLSILLFIIFSHLETSILVLNSIPGVSIFLERVDLYEYKNAVLAVSYFSIIPIWWMSKKTCIYLMAILVLGMQMPLMLAFGLYFVGSHSINAWGHIATKLKTPTKKLYLQSLPFNLGALFIFAIFLYLQGSNASLIQSYAATFFVFLACVSLPHIILMHLFYKK
jgi:Brp/Blh family beta-carotene 15,15'-monooxygenase